MEIIHQAPDFDLVTTEHITYANPTIVDTLTLLFNQCIGSEIVPDNFKRGVKVPIYKGKNTCSLDPGYCRGISLLSSFNKMFEIILWSRLEVWWHDNNIINDSQGA